MIFIVVEEVHTGKSSGGNTDLATMGLISGFIVHDGIRRSPRLNINYISKFSNCLFLHLQNVN